MDQTRREFLRSCAFACAAGTLAYVGIGCSNKTSGDNTGGAQTLTLNLADYPALASDNSVVDFNNNPLGRPILVTHITGDTYYALDSLCTHQACVVAATTPTLNCPCHGSRFSLSGSVVRGPATSSLGSFTVHKNGNTLTIDLP